MVGAILFFVGISGCCQELCTLTYSRYLFDWSNLTASLELTAFGKIFFNFGFQFSEWTLSGATHADRSLDFYLSVNPDCVFFISYS